MDVTPGDRVGGDCGGAGLKVELDDPEDLLQPENSRIPSHRSFLWCIPEFSQPRVPGQLSLLRKAGLEGCNQSLPASASLGDEPIAPPLVTQPALPCMFRKSWAFQVLSWASILPQQQEQLGKPSWQPQTGTSVPPCSLCCGCQGAQGVWGQLAARGGCW